MRNRNHRTEKTTRAPPTAPEIAAYIGEIQSQPAVMETNPAKAPFKANDTSDFLNNIQEMNIATTAPAAADRFVVTAM